MMDPCSSPRKLRRIGNGVREESIRPGSDPRADGLSRTWLPDVIGIGKLGDVFQMLVDGVSDAPCCEPRFLN